MFCCFCNQAGTSILAEVGVETCAKTSGEISQNTKNTPTIYCWFSSEDTSGRLNNHARTLFCIDFICLHKFHAALQKVLFFVILWHFVAHLNFYKGQMLEGLALRQQTEFIVWSVPGPGDAKAEMKG